MTKDEAQMPSLRALMAGGMRAARWLVVVFCLPYTAHTAISAEPLRVLAAFTLKPALDQIAADYRKTGGNVTLVYGPSPGLAQQLENGAPGDLFFSADTM